MGGGRLRAERASPQRNPRHPCRHSPHPCRHPRNPPFPHRHPRVLWRHRPVLRCHPRVCVATHLSWCQTAGARTGRPGFCAGTRRLRNARAGYGVSPGGFIAGEPAPAPGDAGSVMGERVPASGGAGFMAAAARTRSRPAFNPAESGSGLNDAATTSPACPARVATGWPVEAFQIRAVLSSDAVTTRVPSRLNDAAKTQPLCERVATSKGSAQILWRRPLAVGAALRLPAARADQPLFVGRACPHSSLSLFHAG